MIAVLKNSNCLNQFISQHKIIIVKLKRGKRKEERGERGNCKLLNRQET
jgi:hypothetical protein